MTATSSFMDLDTQLNLDFLPVDIKGLVQAYQNAGIRISNMQEQQRQFINNLSHELRTPLTIVYGYLQSTLRRSSNFSEAQRQGLEVATLETDRTIGILQELLEQGRVDSEHIDFYWENLDLNTLVQDVVEMIRDSPMPSPEIILEMATSLIIVRGDRMHLKQAVLGSIDNALKHSNSASAIFVKIKQLGDRVSLKICDRDRYIPPDLLSHIFERFYRMDATHDAISNSSDFSLVSVKSLIEAMGGTIEVESQQGEGTTFAINLPTQSSG
jgi:signal transduction histidine kinase